MRIEVTVLTGEGGVLRGVLDTAACADAARCEHLVEQAALDRPPPYRPVAGGTVYQIRAGGNVVMVAEDQLSGPLLELVRTVLAADGGQAGPGT